MPPEKVVEFRIKGFPEHFLEHNAVDSCDRCFLESLSVRMVGIYRENPEAPLVRRVRDIAAKQKLVRVSEGTPWT